MLEINDPTIDLLLERNPDTLLELERNYPKSILIDLTSVIETVNAAAPQGVLTDFVYVYSKICEFYGDMDGFFSLGDFVHELLYDDTCEYLCSNKSLHEVTSASEVELYCDAIVVSANDLFARMLEHRIPFFADTGSVYKPDAFLCGTKTLKFDLRLE